MACGGRPVSELDGRPEPPPPYSAAVLTHSQEASQLGGAETRRRSGDAAELCRGHREQWAAPGLKPRSGTDATCAAAAGTGAGAARPSQDRPDGVVWSSANVKPLIKLPRVPPSELEEKFRKTKAFKYGRRRLVLKGGLRKPVFEVVERPPSAAAPSRPARASGRHKRKSDQQPSEKARPPRPPPPNLQAARGSPPSYEETLRLDSAAEGRLAGAAASENPFLTSKSQSTVCGTDLAGSPSTVTPPRDALAPGLTSSGRPGSLPAGCDLSDALAANDASSRRSSGKLSTDSASGRSGEAVTGELGSQLPGQVVCTDLPSRRHSAAPCGGGLFGDHEAARGGGSEDGDSTAQLAARSRRAGYNPFFSSPADDDAADDPAPAVVTAPPRLSRGRSSPGSGVTRESSGRDAPFGGARLAHSATTEAVWAGRVSRGSDAHHSGAFTRDGFGRTASVPAAQYSSPFARDTAWAGRVTRAHTSHSQPAAVPTGPTVTPPADTAPSAGAGPAAHCSDQSPGALSYDVRRASAGVSVSPSTSPAALGDSEAACPPAATSVSPPASHRASPVSDAGSHSESDAALHASLGATARRLSTPTTQSSWSARSSLSSVDQAGPPLAAVGAEDLHSAAAADTAAENDSCWGAAAVNGCPADTDRSDGGRSAAAPAPPSGDAGSDDAPPLNWHNCTTQLSDSAVATVAPDTPQAVALSEFRSTAPGDLNFKAGDTLVLLRWVSPDWLLGQLGARHGLLPASLVRVTVPLTGPYASPCPPPSPPLDTQLVEDDGQRVMALYDFAPQEKHDLGFQAGDMVLVTGKLNDDWGYGSRRGVSGQFPLAYVDVAVETVPLI